MHSTCWWHFFAEAAAEVAKEAAAAAEAGFAPT